MPRSPAVVVEPFQTTLAERLAEPKAAHGVSIYWLGQAGFVIDGDGRRIVIDPYLSDSLATKYHGTAFPHTRMAPAPITVEALGAVDLVLCTHHHSDHMDGDTLRPLAARLPDLKFVVPAASLALAEERIGVGRQRLIAVDAGDRLEPLPGLALQVVRAAHETFQYDDAGHHKFLGYALTLAGVTLFHSGDCIPFEGQMQEVGRLAPDLALLPVNGRSRPLADAGFAGNFHLQEAIDLCEGCGIQAMIAHHHGLFAFNTADPADIDRVAAASALPVHRACFQVAFHLCVD